MKLGDFNYTQKTKTVVSAKAKINALMILTTTTILLLSSFSSHFQGI
jgi:hypothetical protein